MLQTWLAHISHREQMRRLRSCTGRLQLSVRQSWLTVWSFLAAVTGATWCHWFGWCFVCRNTWQAKIKVVAAMERHNNTAWKYTFIYLSGLPMLMEAQLNTWGLFNHRQITAFTQNVTHQKFPFLCFANLFCVLQLFRSIEKPEGAHGPREWVSPQGAASKKCHTCKPTERPREHRQACLQHEQNRGGHVRGWWWVSIFYWKFSADPIPFLARNRYFFFPH